MSSLKTKDRSHLKKKVYINDGLTVTLKIEELCDLLR